MVSLSMRLPKLLPLVVKMSSNIPQHNLPARQKAHKKSVYKKLFRVPDMDNLKEQEDEVYRHSVAIIINIV